MDQQQRSASYEQRLRSEVSRGLEQVRQLEQKIQSIESPALYPSLISDAASIMSTFISVIQQLNHASRTNSVASPICSTRLATPPHSPSPHTTSSSSPAEGSPAAATNTPCSIPASLTLDAAASISASAENDRSAETTGVDHELLFPTDWRSNRKRKCMPKRVTKLPANTNEHGGEAPAEDGFTWRKYGQKDILNSKFPRSYYRCTHQKEMGCQATKYVQKCEDDSSMYQVTYIGEHTCQSAQQQQTSLWTCSARPLLDSPLKSSLFSSRLEDMKAARLSLSPSRSTTATGFNLLRPSSTLIPSPSQWLTPKFGGLVCPIKPEPPHLSTPPPHLATQPSPTDTDTDTDKPLLRMSLASGTQAQGEVENQSELGFWNLEELGLEQKVVMEDTSELTVSGSLEHIPKSSLTEDIPWEPMLFE